MLLHGVGGHKGQWARQLADLASDCAVLAWDARGYRDSSGPPVTRMRDFADDLLAVLDGLGLEKVVTVGHSMGGRIAMELAAYAPQRIAGMVLSGAQASYLAHMTTLERDHYVASRKALFEAGRVSARKAAALACQLLPGGADQAARDRLAEDFECLNRDAYLAALGASAGWDRSDVLSGLTMPVAVIGGALDTVCPPGETRRIAGLVGQQEPVILPGVGHMPQIEAPDAVTRFLRGFLARHGHLASSFDTAKPKTGRP